MSDMNNYGTLKGNVTIPDLIRGADGRGVVAFRHVKVEDTFDVYEVEYSDSTFETIKIPRFQSASGGGTSTKVVTYNGGFKDGLVAIPAGAVTLFLAGECSGYMSGGVVYFVFADAGQNIIYSTLIASGSDDQISVVSESVEIPEGAVYFGTHTISVGNYAEGDNIGYNCNLTATLVSDLKIINARSFGAKGDGETDDTDAIQAALHLAEDLGLPLYIPAGNYLVSRTISTYTRGEEEDKQSKLLNIYGAGMGTVFTTTDDFEGDYVFHIDVKNTQPRMLWVHDFAIDLTEKVDVSGIFFREIGMKSVIENLWITFKRLKEVGDPVRAGIFCHSATVTTFQRVKVMGNIHGLDGKRPMNCGIVINEMHSTKIIDCDVIFCGWGIYLSGGSNNLIENCRIDENEYGIYQNTADTSSNILTETRAYKTEDFIGTAYEGAFRGTFFNLTIRKNRFESNNITSVLLLSYGVGNNNYMFNTQVTIADNYVSGLGTGTAMWTDKPVFRNWLHLGRCKGVSIIGNSLKGMPYDSGVAGSTLQNINLSSTIEDLILRDNVATTWPVVQDGSTKGVKSNTRLSSDLTRQLNLINDIEANQTTRQGMSVVRNKPAAAGVDANGKVDVTKCNVFYIDGGATVRSLVLDDSVDLTAGQEVTLIARGAVTIKPGSSLFLNGGVQFDMKEKDTLTLVCMYYNNGRRWFEKSRSVNSTT